MNLSKVYFTDIETIPVKPFLSETSQHMQQCFMKKFQKDFSERNKEIVIEDGDNWPFKYSNAGEIWQEIWIEKAALYPEFARILCVSFGAVLNDGSIKTNCTIDEDEKVVLDQIVKVCEANPVKLVAHNGKGFDYPFIVKRLIINGYNVPDILKIMGKKPWEMPKLIDTQEMWGMGVFNAHVSLDTLAMCFDIPSPKAKMSGSYVAEVWYGPEGTIEEKRQRIAEYCDTDVNVLASVYIQMMKFAG